MLSTITAAWWICLTYTSDLKVMMVKVWIYKLTELSVHQCLNFYVKGSCQSRKTKAKIMYVGHVVKVLVVGLWGGGGGAWRKSRDGRFSQLNRRCCISNHAELHWPREPFQQGSQIHSASALFALWLVSRGGSPQKRRNAPYRKIAPTLKMIDGRKSKQMALTSWRCVETWVWQHFHMLEPI